MAPFIAICTIIDHICLGIYTHVMVDDYASLACGVPALPTTPEITFLFDDVPLENPSISTSSETNYQVRKIRFFESK